MSKFEYHKISVIIANYLNETISPEEEVVLNEWRSISPHHEVLLKKYGSDEFFTEMSELYTPGEEKKLYKTIHKKIKPEKHLNTRFILSIAASFFLLVLSGVTIYHFRPSDVDQIRSFADLKPGNRQATLYLSTGEKVDLTSSTKILPITQQLYKVETDGKKISFSELQHIKDLSNDENHIIVPRGGEYQLALNDQTEIHLNSDSEMYFPTIFSDSLREVGFNGEAYFQVAADTTNPFVIHTFWGLARVVGTAFNLRCYKDEGELQLTLEEGIVQFRAFDEDTWNEVNVGEQLVYSVTNKSYKITKVDTNLYTSWRKGIYAFKSTSLERIMSDLSRWYNVTVTYKDNSLKDITFTGEIKRYYNFNEVVKMLELTQTVHFEWKDSKIHIIN